jgi:hypothetical protein
LTKKNPLVKGRMYKVAGGGRVKGIRFKKGGGIDLLVQDAKRRSNPRKKKAQKKRNAKKRRPAKKRNARKRTTRRARRKK